MSLLGRALLVACLLLPIAAAAQSASRLERIKAARTITVAFAEDAAPFSFREGGQPAGYSVDLCQRVVAGIKAQLKLEELKINWVGASTPERLKLVAAGKADLECGITTHTLRRQEQVEFSLPVFIDGGGVLVAKGSPIVGMPGLDGRKVAVVRGTTTAGHLEAALKKRSATAEVVLAEDRKAPWPCSTAARWRPTWATAVC
jgi:ABC-type amino acid transport substrate-binding protein